MSLRFSCYTSMWEPVLPCRAVFTTLPHVRTPLTFTDKYRQMLALCYWSWDYLSSQKSEPYFFFFYIYFWLCWVFVSARGLSLVAASGGHSSSRCVGLFTIAASLVAEHRLQTRRLSSCGSRAQLLCGMWDLPRPGLEPVSPALAGRFSTTVPPGKPVSPIQNSKCFNISWN